MAQNVLDFFDTSGFTKRPAPAAATTSAQGAPTEALTPAEAGPKPFQLGGSAANVIGAIADAAAEMGGVAPAYAPRLQQQRYENALEAYSADPSTGLEELQKVAPQVAADLETRRLATQAADQEKEAKATEDFYGTLRRARDAGQDLTQVIDAYSRGPYGKLLFDEPGELEQAKAYFAGAPEMIDVMGNEPVTLTATAAERLGFQPGTVVQRGPDGFKVLQEATAANKKTPYTDRGKITADLSAGFITPEEAESEFLALKAPDADSFENADKLRDEYIAQTKDFRDARDAYGRVLASADEPTAAGDLALIFNYMKVLDPGSVVRESEFATAAASGSYGDRIQASVNKVLAGERLSEDQRKDFVQRAGRLFKKQREIAETTAENYRDLSGRFQIDPDLVVQDVTAGFTGDEASGLPRVATAEEWATLKPGQQYLDPEGNVRTKQ